MGRRRAKKRRVVCPDCLLDLVKRTSQYGPFWSCPNWVTGRCDVKIGAHPDGRPLGIPANKETRTARIEAHGLFDQLWKNGRMSRGEAYRWLRFEMALSKKGTHISMFTLEQCRQVVDLVKTVIKNQEIRCPSKNIPASQKLSETPD